MYIYYITDTLNVWTASGRKKPVPMDYSSTQRLVYLLSPVSIPLTQIVQGVNKLVRYSSFSVKVIHFTSVQFFLEPPQPTDDCPHQYGYFRLGDATNCGQFKNCVEGRAYIFDCPEGLAFNGDSYRCDWPDQVLTCDAEGN